MKHPTSADHTLAAKDYRAAGNYHREIGNPDAADFYFSLALAYGSPEPEPQPPSSLPIDVDLDVEETWARMTAAYRGEGAGSFDDDGSREHDD